jgi:hypothetical protein
MHNESGTSSAKDMLYAMYTNVGKRIIPISMYVRPMTLVVKSLGKDNLVGVEIGLENGFNARTMLRTLPIKKLYSIDIHVKDRARKLLSSYKGNIEYVENTSEKAVKDVPDEVDFVYVDGSHQYELVKQDIELYFPKVRNGGVFGGHDFDGSHIDVCRAVFEFSQKNNYPLHGKHKDWWFIKGEKSPSVPKTKTKTLNE